MMGHRGWTVRRWMLVIAGLSIFLSLLATSSQGTNCGGNTAALWKVNLCRDLLIGPMSGMNPNSKTNIAALIRAAKPDVKEMLDQEIAHGSWNRGSRFLIAREPYRNEPSNPRRIVVVCEQPFTNVPRRLWPNAPTHAAALFDGSTGLISVEEFAAFDRTRFVYLDEVLDSIRQEPTPQAVSTP